MKFVSKALMGAAFFAVVSSTPAALAGKQPVGCPQTATQNSWTDLEDALGTCYSLAEGSYEGIGRHTKHRYTLHLMRYLRRDDAFLAVTRDMKNGHSAIGFLVRKGQGNYSWYGIKVSKMPGTNYEYLDIPLNQPPLFNFMLEPDLKGRVARLSAVSENAAAQVEAIDFIEMRAPLMTRVMWPGRWERQKDSLSIMPGENPNSLGAPAPSATWISQLLLNTEKGSSQSSYLIREEAIPGLFVLRKYEQEGYVRKTSDQIAYVGVSIARKYASWIFFEGTEQDFMLFEVQNGFFEATPKRFTHDD